MVQDFGINKILVHMRVSIPKCPLRPSYRSMCYLSELEPFKLGIRLSHLGSRPEVQIKHGEGEGKGASDPQSSCLERAAVFLSHQVHLDFALLTTLIVKHKAPGLHRHKQNVELSLIVSPFQMCGAVLHHWLSPS